MEQRSEPIEAECKDSRYGVEWGPGGGETHYTREGCCLGRSFLARLYIEIESNDFIILGRATDRVL